MGIQIHELATKSGNLSSSDYFVTDNGTVTAKIDYTKLAKAIVEQYSGSTLAGSAQTLQSALNGLNTKTKWYTIYAESYSTKSALLARFDEIMDNGAGVYSAYIVAAQAALLGLPSHAFYVRLTCNSTSFRVAEFLDAPASGQYVMRKTSGTWGDVETLPSRAEMNASWANYGVKNLLRFSGVSKTDSGLTFTVNDDGSVTVSGTNTASSTVSFFITAGHPLTLPVGKYVLTGAPSGGGTSSNTNWFMSLYYNDNMSNNWGTFDFGEGATYNLTASTNTKLGVRIGIGGGKTVNETFYPMLRPASIPDDTFVPYAPNNAELAPLLDQSWVTFSNTSLLTTQADNLAYPAHYFGAIASYGHQSETGVPANNAFYVEVYRQTANYSVIRLIAQNATGAEYTCTKNGSDWNAWQRITKTAV